MFILIGLIFHELIKIIFFRYLILWIKVTSLYSKLHIQIHDLLYHRCINPPNPQNWYPTSFFSQNVSTFTHETRLTFTYKPSLNDLLSFDFFTTRYQICSYLIFLLHHTNETAINSIRNKKKISL